MKELRFDIVPGLNCNFRCQYCYEKGQYENTKFLLETLEKTIKFILNAYSLCKKEENDLILHLYFFGGEPLLYINEICYIVSALAKRIKIINKSYPEGKFKFIVNITTNGSLVENCFNNLLKLKRKCIPVINVSYDYFMQNMTRMPGTYDSVRKSITKLHQNGFEVKTITTFSTENLKYFYETVKDYYDFIIDKTNRNNFYYNIDSSIATKTNVMLNEKEFIESLEKTNEYIKYNNLDKSKIRKNTHCSITDGFSRSSLAAKIANNDLEALKNIYDGTFFAGVFCCIDYSGEIHTGITSLFVPLKNEFKLGTVNDSPEIIIERYKALVEKIYNGSDMKKTVEKCISCNNDCKLNYLRTIRNNDILTVHSMPNPEFCRIQDLLSEYNLSQPKDISFYKK